MQNAAKFLQIRRLFRIIQKLAALMPVASQRLNALMQPKRVYFASVQDLRRQLIKCFMAYCHIVFLPLVPNLCLQHTTWDVHVTIMQLVHVTIQSISFHGDFFFFFYNRNTQTYVYSYGYKIVAPNFWKEIQRTAQWN